MTTSTPPITPVLVADQPTLLQAETPKIVQWVESVTAFSTEYSGWPATNVVGASNTYPNYGDLKTAWAPSTSTGTQEFLELKYATKVLITGIKIYETYNPGAVVKISAKKDNAWVALYTGNPQQNICLPQARIFSPPLTQGIISDEIRLDLDCANSASYSEIDAVELFGEDPDASATKAAENQGNKREAVFGKPLYEYLASNGSKYCDVTLSHNSQKYPCHRILLSKCSVFFKELFLAKPEEKDFTIEYEDPQNIFPLVIKYIYTNSIPIDPSNMLSIKEAATFLKLNALIGAVERFLNKRLTDDMVFSLMQTGLAQEGKEDDVLVKKAVEYIAKNFLQLLPRIKEQLEWIPMVVISRIIGHNNFCCPENSMCEATAFVKQIMEKFDVLKNPEAIATLLPALAKANILKADVAFSFLNSTCQINANSQNNNQLPEDLLNVCYPVLAAEFEQLEDQPVQGNICKQDYLKIAPKSFVEILSCDDLMAGSEDLVYEFCLKYLEANPSISDEDKLNVMRSVRYTFMSLVKLQALVKELSDANGRAFIKAMDNDLMQALCARMNRTEGNENNSAPSGNEEQQQVLNTKMFKPRMKRLFTYQSNFDTNGIFYWIGCGYGTTKYENPVTKGYIKITASTTFEAGKADLLINHTPCACNMHSQSNANFVIDLGKVSIAPTKYSLRHTDSRDTECLRNWTLQGSVDGTNWVLLKEHKDDQAITAKSASHTWDISDSKQGFYKFFRLEQTGNNSANSTYLSCAGMEMYGYVRMS